MLTAESQRVVVIECRPSFPALFDLVAAECGLRVISYRPGRVRLVQLVCYARLQVYLSILDWWVTAERLWEDVYRFGRPERFVGNARWSVSKSGRSVDFLYQRMGLVEVATDQLPLDSDSSSTMAVGIRAR